MGLICYRYWDRAMPAAVPVPADPLPLGAAARSESQAHFEAASREMKGEGAL